MKSVNCIALLVIVSSLLGASAKLSDAAQAHGFAGQRGGRAATHMSGKAAANSNGQWSADPERGWVRAEKRKGLKDQRNGSTQRAQGKVKQNDKGKKF
jgi:hypothetical protein